MLSILKNLRESDFRLNQSFSFSLLTDLLKKSCLISKCDGEPDKLIFLQDREPAVTQSHVNVEIQIQANNKLTAGYH